MKIIPTILTKNKKEFLSRLKTVSQFTKTIQVDFLNNTFIPQKTLPLKDIPSLKNYNAEAHLMINNPENYLKELKRKGFKKIIVHIETLDDPNKFLSITKEFKIFIALNPKTPTKKVEPHLKKISGVLFMGVPPGRNGARFLPSTIKKIQAFHKKHPNVKIQVDGGVNDKTVSKLAKVGATILNSGSFIAKAKNPKETYKLLTKISKPF